MVMGKFFTGLIDRGIFDWQSDMILIPYGKQFGSISLNKAIAQHLSMGRDEPTYEVIAGFNKHYYAVGDKVLVNKKEGVIRKITKNAQYRGRAPLPASLELHRDGGYISKDGGKITKAEEDIPMSGDEVDEYLLVISANQNLGEKEDDEAENQASHRLEIELLYEQMEDGSNQTTISTRGEYSKLELAYAITIHKAQGSEWRKVFLILHNSHIHLNRELLYTAVTRASQQLFIVCEPDSFSKGVMKQRIKGDTLAEKIAWFKAKIAEKEGNSTNSKPSEGLTS